MCRMRKSWTRYSGKGVGVLVICHDCAVAEGEIHKFGCDMERCPFCGRQLISCDCHIEKLRLAGGANDCDDLSGDQENAWVDILDAKGRIPYIRYPNVCARCGALYPDMFRVPDSEWKRYVEPAMRSKMLCRPCYDLIKSAIDNARQCKGGDAAAQ